MKNIERAAQDVILEQIAPYRPALTVLFRVQDNNRVKVTFHHKGKVAVLYFSRNSDHRHVLDSIRSDTRSKLRSMGIPIGQPRWLKQPIKQQQIDILENSEPIVPEEPVKEPQEEKEMLRVVNPNNPPLAMAKTRNKYRLNDTIKGKLSQALFAHATIQDEVVTYHDGWNDARLRDMFLPGADLNVIILWRRRSYGRTKQEVALSRARFEAREQRLTQEQRIVQLEVLVHRLVTELGMDMEQPTE